MAVTSTPVFPQNIQNWGASFTSADTTTRKTIISAGTNGTKVEFFDFATDESTSRVFSIYLSDGTNDYQLGVLNVLNAAGNTAALGSPPLSVLQGGNFPNFPFDNNGNRFIYLKAGWSIKVACQSTITAAKTVWVKAFGSDF